MAFQKKQDIKFFDYKDFKTLQRFISPYGQILPRKKTALSSAQQRELSAAVKRARHLALLPFVVK